MFETIMSGIALGTCNTALGAYLFKKHDEDKDFAEPRDKYIISRAEAFTLGMGFIALAIAPLPLFTILITTGAALIASPVIMKLVGSFV